MKRLLVAALAIVGILAAGCIVRFGSLYTVSGTTHFVGLASNLSKVDVVDAEVQVVFLDSSNRVLDTKTVDPCTRTLQIGQNSPFEAVAHSGVKANHVQTSVQWLTLGHKAVADLDVDHIVITKSGDTYHMGNLEVGGKALYSINVCAAMFDKNGNVVKVGKAAASPKDIGKGDDGSFDVSLTYDEKAVKYELWIDAVIHSPTDVTAPVVVGPATIKVATPTPTPTKTKTPIPTSTHTPEPPTETPTPT
jgi:hypothetical protein